ncbi:MAG: hypothetical protein E7340_01790 [Clostridiales bacterium]|nr:hypothetical protein [Clostridiales bacterium]
MKKLLTTIVALMLVVCSLFSLAACGDTGAGGGGGEGGGGGAHVHDYIDHVCSCGDVEKYTEGLKYHEYDGEITIRGFEEGVEVPNVVYIPQKINGKPVRYIGNNAFENATFTQIVLPEGLLEIFSDAFTNSNLSAITFPASLKVIHPRAFDTPNLATATFKCTEGWYLTRNVQTTKPSGEGKDPSFLAKPATNAARLTNCGTSGQGGEKPGNNYWYRFD